MFTLTLNNRCLLKKEIEAMRQQRPEAGNDYVWNIALQKWTKETNETAPILYVRALSSNLWVKEYSIDNLTWHKFDEIFSRFSINYGEEDKGCLLYATNIIEMIESFTELVKNNSLDDTEQRDNIRSAFVMIVYVSSEMIKNEILQKALDTTTYEGERRQYTWAELKFLYKNFSILSKKLYKTNNSYYQTIYIKDFVDMFVRVSDNRDGARALQIINSLGVYVDPDLLKRMKERYNLS